MPSVKQFKKSSNPSFIDEYGAFSTSYLKTGANLDKNPDFLYSFGEGKGTSTVGYFFPYVKHTADDGIASIVPPAAFIATAYMRKQLSTSAGVYPWTIVAGVSQGKVTGIGSTEMDFTDDDLENLASIGVNPITYVRNVGYVINDESTAQVYPVSSLSYIHSREVLIDLENDLYDMLLRYQWKFNTATIRSEIKYKADQICKSYADKGALYAYQNIMDLTNNTNYIIDLQGGVLDTKIEIVKGMGWIVNSISIEKTGSINSTGFTE
jgi:transcription initiation factor IIE alpha subunit